MEFTDMGKVMYMGEQKHIGRTTEWINKSRVSGIFTSEGNGTDSFDVENPFASSAYILWTLTTLNSEKTYDEYQEEFE
jgi:hypothetical protein